jgi:eukaryotic-like serine/threonine-protein kinase
MTPERYQQIDQIFQAALALEPKQRAAYLDEACSGDEKLRQDVESLITSDLGGLSFIDQPALEMAARVLASDEPALAAGDLIDRYEVVSLLGSGGMGEVYLAHDEKLDRKIALKLLPPHFTTNEVRLRRFRQEARAASALNHPNIITIHEIGQVENRHFIATEFVDGETLRQRMKREPLSLNESQDIAIQVCGALAAAANAGIVHRDIKPENIMLRRDGYVKVLDFGLAKLTEQREQPTEVDAANDVDLSSGLLMGTVKYMSPEQAQGAQVDQRSDIFSLGVVLYEMIAGHAPFAGRTTSDLLSAITSEEPLPLKHYAPGTVDELQRLITKALRKVKDARYQTVEELLVDLKKLKEGSTGPSVAHLISGMKQHKTAARIGLAFLIVAITGILFGLYKFFKSRSSNIPFQNMKVTKLTSFGHVIDPAISPDGKYVAYTKYEVGGRSIRLRIVGTTSESQIVSATEGDLLGTTFSPDGKYIVYTLYLGDERSTYIVPVLGGSAKKLPLKGPRGVSFSPDGRRLAYLYNNFPEGKTSLVIANADGTGEREVVTRQAPNYYWTAIKPSWSPDGKLVTCVGQNGTESFPHIFAVNVETGAERPITAQRWADMGGIAWLPDMSGLLTVATEETSSIPQIWDISYPSGVAHRVTNDTNSYFGLSLAADGSALVTTKTELPLSISVMPVNGTESTPGSSGTLSIDSGNTRLIESSNLAGGAAYIRLAWAPDDTIVYMSEESGNADIWSIKADGSDRKQLTTDPHRDTSPDVSPDGRYIAFMSNRAGTENIWRMDIDGGNQKRLTNKHVERTPVFSADSKWVFFEGWETGKVTIWKLPVEGGEPVQVTADLSFNPAVSPDGSLLAYDGPGKLVIAPSAGGQPIKTFEPRGGMYQWLPGRQLLSYLSVPGRQLLSYLSAETGANKIWVQSRYGGEPQQLFDFEEWDPVFAYAWSRDAKKLAVARANPTSDVILISEIK